MADHHGGRGDHRRDQEHGLANVVAGHYNSIKNVGVEARKESRIYHMRIFNNWIKSMLIGETLENLRKERDFSTKITVLDMACGKGGDLKKWKIGKIHHLICTDIAETSLTHCKERYEEMGQFDSGQMQTRHRGGGFNRGYNQRGNQMFTAEFFAADSTRARLRSLYRDASMKIDVVSCQFAFHYSFESLEQAEIMIKNAAECLSAGGYFIGTTPDSYDIVRRVREAGSRTVGNEIYSITFESDDILDESKPVPLFGAEYKFHLDDCVDCPEFLVYFPALEEMAANYDLKLVFRERFEDYYHNMKETQEGSNLLKRMKVLEGFPPRSDGSAMFDDSEYLHAKEFVDKLGENERRKFVGTLSKAEWEAISLYLVFVFRKMDSKEIREREEQRKLQKTDSSDTSSSKNEERKSSSPAPEPAAKKKFCPSRDVSDGSSRPSDKLLTSKENVSSLPKIEAKPIKRKFFTSRDDKPEKTYEFNAMAFFNPSANTKTKGLQVTRTASPNPEDSKKQTVQPKKANKFFKSRNEKPADKVIQLTANAILNLDTTIRTSQRIQEKKQSTSPCKCLDKDDHVHEKKTYQSSRTTRRSQPLPSSSEEDMKGKSVYYKSEQFTSVRITRTSPSTEVHSVQQSSVTDFVCDSPASLAADSPPPVSPEPDDKMDDETVDEPSENLLDQESSEVVEHEVKKDSIDIDLPPEAEVPEEEEVQFADSQSSVEPLSQPMAPPTLPSKPKKKFFSSRTAKVEKLEKANFNAKAFFDFDETISASSQATSTATSSQGSSTDSEYYTVHRVRKAHQCHDLGETEKFDDDIKFYMDSLYESQSPSVRCLSIIGLSGQCMQTAFRMHLRAHDYMPKIIGALKDASKDVNLAFCTSALMFVYNQDRLTMDIDRDHLGLMLDLLETKDEVSAKVDKRHVDKVQDLVEQMKDRDFGKFLDPKNLTSGKLAMEALLGLTSKRAGDWFKEELRRLQGLDYLMTTVNNILDVDANLLVESQLNKVDRTLRVLEGATFMNEENQLYVINFEEGKFVTTCIRLLRSNKDNIVCFPDSKMYLSSLLSVLRVFSNITSESATGSELMGTRFTELFELLIETVFEVPSFIVPDSRFDLTILVLCLCINLVEFCVQLRVHLMDANRKVKRLVEMLLDRVEQARMTEQQADELFESAEKKKNEVVNIDTLLNQVVAQSGKHMEHSIIAACVSLLIGCAIQDESHWKDKIAQLLPDGSFEPLIDVLNKLHEFARLADIMTPSGIRRVKKILDVFKGKYSPRKRETKATCSSSKSSIVEDEPSLLSVSASFFKCDSDDDDDEFSFNHTIKSTY
ncbi:mRNA cap guanine-N7 methyltransferase [Halotydeus destructor]|nr:mRNA cap guanine-N7 methyltransferase [Halotydeus destructor]